jgi:hypothetical protein
LLAPLRVHVITSAFSVYVPDGRAPACKEAISIAYARIHPGVGVHLLAFVHACSRACRSMLMRSTCRAVVYARRVPSARHTRYHRTRRHRSCGGSVSSLLRRWRGCHDGRAVRCAEHRARLSVGLFLPPLGVGLEPTRVSTILAPRPVFTPRVRYAGTAARLGCQRAALHSALDEIRALVVHCVLEAGGISAASRNRASTDLAALCQTLAPM